MHAREQTGHFHEPCHFDKCGDGEIIHNLIFRNPTYGVNYITMAQEPPTLSNDLILSKTLGPFNENDDDLSMVV